jgi:rhodanese-related sulfurtransferase
MTAQELVAEAKKAIRETDVAGAREMVGKVPVLDVREPAEFAAGSLPGAVNIPRGLLEFQIGNHPAFRGAEASPFLVYCQSGGRSALAAEVLQKLGYSQPVSLAGGFKAWQDAGEKVA